MNRMHQKVRKTANGPPRPTRTVATTDPGITVPRPATGSGTMSVSPTRVTRAWVDEHNYLDDVGEAVASTLGSVTGRGDDADHRTDERRPGTRHVPETETSIDDKPQPADGNARD